MPSEAAEVLVLSLPPQGSACNTLAVWMLPGFQGPLRDLVHRVKEFLPQPPHDAPHMLFPGGCRRLVQVGLCLHQAHLRSLPSLAPVLKGTGLAGAFVGLSSLVFWAVAVPASKLGNTRRRRTWSPPRSVPGAPGPCPLGLPSQLLWAFSRTEGEGWGAHALPCPEQRACAGF